MSLATFKGPLNINVLLSIQEAMSFAYSDTWEADCIIMLTVYHGSDKSKNILALV